MLYSETPMEITETTISIIVKTMYFRTLSSVFSISINLPILQWKFSGFQAKGEQLSRFSSAKIITEQKF